MYLSVFVCTACVQYPKITGDVRVSGTGLQGIVRCPVGAGNGTMPAGRASSALTTELSFYTGICEYADPTVSIAAYKTLFISIFSYYCDLVK